MAVEQTIEQETIKAEQKVLGSMLIRPEVTTQVAATLKPVDFYRYNHQQIFGALLAYRNEYPEADVGDPGYIQDYVLKSGGDPEEWECAVYLNSCVEEAVTAANVLIHAKIVKRYSALRRQQRFQQELKTKIAKPDADPDKVSSWARSELEEIGRTCDTDLVRVGDVLHSHLAWLGESAHKIGIEGYSTGFSALDCVTGGYGQPMFVLFKGKRKKGKTHHLIQPTYNCLKAGMAAVLISMDTPRKLMLNRFLAYLTGINSFRIRRMSRDEDMAEVAQACEWLFKQPLFICERSGHTVNEIEAKCELVTGMGHRIGLVAIDYAELMGSDKPSTSREQELTQMAVGLQNLRNKLGTTVLLLSQINKEGRARWSEGLENACDLILSWEVTDQGGHVGQLMTDGNRLGGDAMIECIFDWGTSRIRETYLDTSDPAYPPKWPWWYKPVGEPAVEEEYESIFGED
jgi:replicative DNA helicase